MKIEELKQKQKVTPVTITLETEEEIKIMMALIGLISYTDNSAKVTNAVTNKEGTILISVYFLEKELNKIYHFLSAHLHKFEL